MNPLSPKQILRNLENGFFMTHQEQTEAAKYIWQLQQSNEAMLEELVRYADEIFKLRKELAKPEQEFYPDWDMIKPFHERIKELEEQLAKPEQAPFGYFYEINGTYTDFSNELPPDDGYDKGTLVPVYTTPRKEWVGLTDEEIKELLDCKRGGLIDIKKAEQMLKEKNT